MVAENDDPARESMTSCWMGGGSALRAKFARMANGYGEIIKFIHYGRKMHMGSLGSRELV